MSYELFCQECQRALDERQLSMKSLTIESCPFCGTTVRQTDGMRATNLDALVMEDIAAIDGWLDTHASAMGFLSTSTLCEELFEPLVATLATAMTAVSQELAGE